MYTDAGQVNTDAGQVEISIFIMQFSSVLLYYVMRRACRDYDIIQALRRLTVTVQALRRLTVTVQALRRLTVTVQALRRLTVTITILLFTVCSNLHLNVVV